MRKVGAISPGLFCCSICRYRFRRDAGGFGRDDSAFRQRKLIIIHHLLFSTEKRTVFSSAAFFYGHCRLRAIKPSPQPKGGHEMSSRTAYFHATENIFARILVLASIGFILMLMALGLLW